MVIRLLPTKQKTSKSSYDGTLPRTPNGYTDFPFRIPFIAIVTRTLLWLGSILFSTLYLLNVIVFERAARSKDHILRNAILILSLLVSVLAEIAVIYAWISIQDKQLTVDSFKKCVRRNNASVVVRITCLILVFAVTNNHIVYIHVTAVVVGLLVDFVVGSFSYSYYKKLFASQLTEITEGLRSFVGPGFEVDQLSQTVQLGYFTELWVRKNQISQHRYATGYVSGGLVLFKGKLVYFCDAHEYFYRVREMVVLQGRERTLRTEHLLLIGEDVEEDKRSKQARYSRGDFIINFGEVHPLPLVYGGRGLRPPGGLFVRLDRMEFFALLEDCGAIEREILQTEERLDRMRAENGALRNTSELQKKKEPFVVEPMEENIINDVD